MDLENFRIPLKDQYVGDINDYAKYLLLRLARSSFDPVIVAWMLTAKDSRSDGARIQYLSQPGWRDEDQKLFDSLGRLVAEGDRSIAGVERALILEGCVFASDPIDRGAEARADYFAALERLAGPDALVFFDPDNGLEVPSVPRHRRGAERYLYWEDLIAFREASASVLIYQHFPRVERTLYLDRLLSRLAEETGPESVVFAAYTSQVAFLFSLQPEKADRLYAEVERHCATSRLISFRAYR